jgi:hypothetical protein
MKGKRHLSGTFAIGGAAVNDSYIRHYEGPRNQALTTPLEFFDLLNDRWGFTLDGASDDHNTLLPKHSTSEVPLPWEGERVFCNPPWSDIAPFVELAATAEFACLLVPARANCRWFHRALALGAKPEFWLGKLRFGASRWNSPVDCLLLLFGKEEHR